MLVSFGHGDSRGICADPPDKFERVSVIPYAVHGIINVGTSTLGKLQKYGWDSAGLAAGQYGLSWLAENSVGHQINIRGRFRQYVA
jgi:hypothetical protein